MRILNLYAGAGGNRVLWGDEHEIVAVEIDSEIAEIYSERFPNDTVVIADAHQFLIEHHKEFDFIWSSPPCQTHSDIRRMAVDKGLCEAKFPDMTLYEEIIFLTHYATCKWVVENVVPFYKPLIQPLVRGRHCFWSNFHIGGFSNSSDVIIKNVSSNTEVYGLNLTGKKLKNRKDQILRNQVDPKLGLHVLRSAFNEVQVTLCK